MNTFENLLEIAHKKEKVVSRRLAKRTGISAEAALKQTLEASAGSCPLADLIATRIQAKSTQQAKIILRKQQQADARMQKAMLKLPDGDSWLAWFDGATHPNPGKMGIGGILKNPAGAITEISFAAGLGDSSEAEYLALIAVLQAAINMQPEKLVVYGDSRVVIDDVQTAIGGVRALHSRREQARQLIARLPDVVLRWIPRAKNAAADALSQQAIRAPS